MHACLALGLIDNPDSLAQGEPCLRVLTAGGFVSATAYNEVCGAGDDACAPGHCPDSIQDCINGPMKQSPARQLEEMHGTLIRALASLENHDDTETHRLLALLRGMIEGALAEAQRGRWWR